MFKILIYDNSQEAMLIKNYIQNYQNKYQIDFQIEIMTSYSDFVYAQNCFYDIAFINIDSSFLGFQVIEHLKKINTNIFVMIIAAFYTDIDKALELHVFRYLIRPVNKDRFENFFNELICSCQSLHKYIAVETKEKIYKISISDILYIETQKHGSMIKTQNNMYLLNKTKPKEWEKIIQQPKIFIYSHNSFLVNLQHVIYFDKSFVTLSLNNGNDETVYMSQRKYSNFKKAFINFLNKNDNH